MTTISAIRYASYPQAIAVRLRGEAVVSDEVYQSLVDLVDAASPDIAQRVALATLAGACRAICELNEDRLDERHIRLLVLAQLKDASPACGEIFCTEQ